MVVLRIELRDACFCSQMVKGFHNFGIRIPQRVRVDKKGPKSITILTILLIFARYAANPNWYAANPNWYEANPNWYEANPNRYAANPNWYASNPNRYAANPNWYAANNSTRNLRSE